MLQMILMLLEGEHKLNLFSLVKFHRNYILDERMRELVVEEPRRKTLVRLNKLYERTMKYNFRVKDNMEPYHELWPIPQTAIDANTGAKLLQNPGYPGAAE